jgi:hypothetical protein
MSEQINSNYKYNKNKDLNKTKHTLDESNDINHVPENDKYENPESADSQYSNKLNENQNSKNQE